MDSTQPSAEQEPAAPSPQLDIGYGLPPGATVVSRRAWLVDEAGVRTVLVGRTVVFQYELADRASHRYAAALLAHGKHATQAQVGPAFGMDRRSASRLCRLSDRSGIAGFVRKIRSDKTKGAVCAKVCRLRQEGKRVAEIAERTGVSARTVRTILEAIRRQLDAMANPRLLLIDTWKAFRPPAAGGKNAYDEGYEAAQPLLDLVTTRRLPTVVAVHVTKAAFDDPFDSIQGSGLQHVADTLILLKRAFRSPYGQILITGRLCPERKYNASYAEQLWTFGGDADDEEDGDDPTARHPIIAALEGATGPLRAHQLAELTGKKETVVKADISRLRKRGCPIRSTPDGYVLDLSRSRPAP